MWHIRSGTITKAGNESQGWARAVVGFPVPYRHDIPQVRRVMARTATGMRQEPARQKVILEEPEATARAVLGDASAPQPGRRTTRRVSHPGHVT